MHPGAKLPERFPRLLAAIEEGDVWWESTEGAYFGMAGDGQNVYMGTDPTRLERYLTDRPSPNDW